jgi:serine/threonine protein kinase
MTDFSGKTLGQYELKSVIGRGGTATVYHARQKSTGRHFALKVIDSQFVQDPEFIARFKREIDLQRKLNHRYLLTLTDSGVEDEVLYSVLPLLTGGSLKRIIANHPGGLLLGQIETLLMQLADGLSYLHAQGIIHRDLKPSNVLFDEQNQPYITDFGVADLLQPDPDFEDITNITGQDGGFIGTPVYMAPEQWQLGKIDARTDLYALGVMLYEMLTGKPPYQGDTPFALLMGHINGSPPPLHQHREGLPLALDAVIAKALAKAPDQRYQSAYDLYTAFALAISGNIDREESRKSQQSPPRPAPGSPAPPVPAPQSGPSYPLYPPQTAAGRSTNPLTGLLNTMGSLVDGFFANKSKSKPILEKEPEFGSLEVEDLLSKTWYPPAPPPPTLQTLNEGDHIAGVYTLKKRLDKGDNSRVYHAFDEKRRREVAIKFLAPTQDQQRQKRFQQEAELLGRLQHPHIIAFYDYDSHNGLNYLVMPMLSGGTLRERINQGLPTLPFIQGVAVQLISALDYVHDQGVVHRDLKASNVLFDSRDQSYLVDFGIAKVLDPGESLFQTMVGAMPIGSASYMAPEQWMGGEISAATDQYALGVLLYQMLTGQLPIDAPNLYKAAYEYPKPLSTFRADLPRALEPVIMRTLAKRPDERFPSLTELQTALEAALQNRPIHTPNPPVTPMTTPTSGEAYTPQAPHVFISYSSQQEAYAHRLDEHLRKEGFNVWIARQIVYGDDFWLTIVEAIKTCGAVLVIMSPQSEKSQWVQREIMSAERFEKEVLPLLYEGESFLQFGRKHYVTVTGGMLPPDKFLEALSLHVPRNPHGMGVAVQIKI